MVTWVVVQSRGQRSINRNLPPAGQPRHMHVCGCVLAYADKRLTILYYLRPFTYTPLIIMIYVYNFYVY